MVNVYPVVIFKVIELVLLLILSILIAHTGNY